MSYSFNTRGADKAELKTSVAAELDKVVEQQPIHEKDRDVAEACAHGLIDAVRDPKESEAIVANINGSCYSTTGEGLDGASANVSISFAPK